MTRPTLDLDRPRPLALTFGALERYEQRTGQNALHPDTFVDMTATDMLTLVWACLIAGAEQDGPGERREWLTRDWVGQRLDHSRLLELQQTLDQLWTVSLPDAGETDREADPMGPTRRSSSWRHWLSLICVWILRRTDPARLASCTTCSSATGSPSSEPTTEQAS